jgi:hypothetical protein
VFHGNELRISSAVCNDVCAFTIIIREVCASVLLNSGL